jgi:hypothetical protein
MEVDARLDFADVDDFVREAFKSGGRGSVRSTVRSFEIPSQADGGYGIQSTMRDPLLLDHVHG